MNRSRYLEYSAKEPMTMLRKKFNNGESLYKSTPAVLSVDAAKEDVSYVQYVIENAYSGYSYYDEALFGVAFDSIRKELSAHETVSSNALIDLICAHLSFISDGHLSLSTQDYGNGFYKKVQTYVSDLIVTEIDGRYFDLDTGEQVSLDSTVRVFPTIVNDVANANLVGIRSKDKVEEISIGIGNKKANVPVHKIKSQVATEESLVKECYLGDIAIITCSSFVGDSEESLNYLYEVGTKCRGYKHVVWDLSNNLGGNSEFPKRFLLGLTGGFYDTVKFLELKSTLVHAKEFGDIQNIPYHVEPIFDEKMADTNLFDGELHVIINDMVASSAEMAIAWADSLPRVTFYGCNSLGIGCFGDLCIYYLPNSQITLWCPQKVFDTNIVETVGFEPNYWIDSNDVVSSVLKMIASSGR